MKDYSLSLTADGWQKIESMARPNFESKQAFVAMWFDETMDEVFKNGIIPIEEDTGFNMFRVDVNFRTFSKRNSPSNKGLGAIWN